MLHRMVRRRPWVCGLTEPATCLRLQPEGSSGTASAKFPSCRGCRHPKSHTFSTGADTALSIVRTQSGNRKLSEILNEAEKAWQDSQYPSKITFQLLHLHDELEDQDTDGAIQATAPTLIATAERNQLLDTDLMTTERGNPAREKEELSWKHPSTATCISVALPHAQEVVLFRCHDASFPQLRRKGVQGAGSDGADTSALQDMVLQRQPQLFLLIAEPNFPLAELSSRLECIFDKSYVLAAYARAVLPALRPPRILALGGAETPAPGPEGGAEGGDAPVPRALGLAVFGDQTLSADDAGRLACCLLGSSWLGNFSLDQALTRQLFVPRHWTLGLQPPTHRYRSVSDTQARDLPLFRLQSVLFPGCSLILKVFEPRYRRMVKQCLERNEPFGLVHARDTVGTLASITEVYRLEEETGVSILRVSGTRRFQMEGSRLAEDSFGLLTATRARFFDEDPVEDLEELEALRLQARTCLTSSLAAASASAMGPPPPLSLLQDAPLRPSPGGGKDGNGQSTRGQPRSGGREQTGGVEELARALANESFLLSQWLVDSYQSLLPDGKKVEWLRTRSTRERMRGCLDLLLRLVREGKGRVRGGTEPGKEGSV